MVFAVYRIATDARAQALALDMKEKLTARGAGAILYPEGELPLPPFDADAAIAFGGDGFILAVSRLMTRCGHKPLLGVNCGHLGYLATLQSVTDEAANRLAAGDFEIKKRMMLEVTFGSGEERTCEYALNDLVLTRTSDQARSLGVTRIEAFADENSLGSYRADGMIVSTPTGSTAYALSAGGSVVDPDMSCICLTPICAHSLAARQIVLSKDRVLRLVNRDPKAEKLLCAIDGTVEKTLLAGESVRVAASGESANFIAFKEGFFFDTVRKKLIDEIIV